MFGNNQLQIPWGVKHGNKWNDFFKNKSYYIISSTNSESLKGNIYLDVRKILSLSHKCRYQKTCENVVYILVKIGYPTFKKLTSLAWLWVGAGAG